MKKKAIISSIFLIIALAVGVYLLLQDGKDQTVIAKTVKRSSLTSETINAAFLQVGGKVTEVYVKEGDQIKAGQPLVQLDTTDIDLQMQQLNVTMGKLDIQVNQINTTITNAQNKIHITQEKAKLGIDSAKVVADAIDNTVKPEDLEQQHIVIESAQEAVEVAQKNVANAVSAVATAEDAYQLAVTNLARIEALHESGLNSQVELEQAHSRVDNMLTQLNLAKNQEENAKSQLKIAENTVKQQQTVLQKLEKGATAEDYKRADLAIQQAQLTLSEAQLAMADTNVQSYNLDILTKEKENLLLQFENLQHTKAKMTLLAPTDGTVKTVIPSIGENVALGGVAAVIETNQLYFEIFVSEEQIVSLVEGKSMETRIVPLNKTVPGKISTTNTAPKFASMRMAGETGSDEITSYLVKVLVEKEDQLLSGMTVEVDLHEAVH